MCMLKETYKATSLSLYLAKLRPYKVAMVTYKSIYIDSEFNYR